MNIVQFIEARLIEEKHAAQVQAEVIGHESTREIRRSTAIREMLDHLVLMATDHLYSWPDAPLDALSGYHDITPTLRCAAAIWSDHPDYQQDWATP